MKIKIPAIVRIVVMIVIIVLIMVMILVMYRTWKYPGTVTEKIPLYAYSQKAVVDYWADYRANILTGATTVGAGETYINEYLNNILTSFNYEFTGERAAEYKGQYNITATLVGSKKVQEKVVNIWKKDYLLVPSTPFAGTEAAFKLSRELPINIGPYNDFVEKFLEETKINSEVNLVVRWNVTLAANTDKGVITETAAPTLVIPINESYFNITGEQKNEKKGAIEESKTKVLPVNNKLLYLCSAGLLLFLAALAFLVFYTRGVRLTDPLAIRMKEIFKKHGERLVALGSEAVINGNVMIPVKTLEDLIKIADELSKPVMYKIESEAEKMPVFCVSDEPKIYVYELPEPLKKPLVKEAVSTITVGIEKDQGKEA